MLLIINNLPNNRSIFIYGKVSQLKTEEFRQYSSAFVVRNTLLYEQLLLTRILLESCNVFFFFCKQLIYSDSVFVGEFLQFI